MAVNADRTPEWMLRLRAELTRDKKKTAVLGILLVVAMVLGVRLVAKRLPDSADAAVRPVAAPVPTARPAEPPPLRQTLQQDMEASRQKANKQYLEGLRPDFSRDLFKPNEDYFAPEKTPEPQPVAVTPVATGPTPEEIAAQEARRREAQREVIRKQAEALELQSVMLGATPTALINGRVIRVGDEVDGFRVNQIDSGGCTVQKRDVTVRLNLKQ